MRAGRQQQQQQEGWRDPGGRLSLVTGSSGLARWADARVADADASLESTEKRKDLSRRLFRDVQIQNS